jgi:hypothetical protein
MAPRRQRLFVKIILSYAPSGTRTDGFGTRIISVENFTPHLQQVLLDELTELVSGFIKGRYSFKNRRDDEICSTNLSQLPLGRMESLLRDIVHRVRTGNLSPSQGVDAIDRLRRAIERRSHRLPTAMSLHTMTMPTGPPESP